jgi:hypothetical protein
MCVTWGEELPEVYYGAQEWSCIGEWRESEERRRRVGEERARKESLKRESRREEAYLPG